MQDLLSILKQYWGYEEFRPLQAEIIQSVVNGKDTLALLPTGGGKSVCYQVPALAQNGLCLVISPLIALMKDQVENLKKKGVMALAIYSGQSRRQIVQTLKNAAYGDYKLLYISPERLETQLFKEYLPALGVNLIAVDEAHCISQWGYDFRPSYLKIQELRKELPNVPVLALTASATKEVQQDICNKLGFKEINIYRQSYERKNLSYSVFKVDAKIAKLVDIAGKVPGTGIIYCKSRKRTVEIANLLQMHGLSAQYYHAGLQPEDRSSRQQEWIDGNVKIMVCTNAFGMGIDKPDVRLVIHADMPDCLENYYQEAGRAGRDGKRSYAVLLNDEQDATELQQLYKTRYPDFERIKKVYEGLVNFLQVPSHYGENISYTFRFDEFIRNFKLPSTETLYALKALEADGWIFFNEKSFTPSSIVFNTTKQQLNDVFSAYPSLEPLITMLLRNYEGIFDYPAYISENLLGKLLRKSEEEIKKGLVEIASLNIIRYTSQNESPQIIFRENRPAVQDLTLNLTEYNKRKAAFIDRVEQIVQYTKIKSCRSGFINEYFGDATPPCGVCDNCLALKNIEVSPEEFKSITTLIEKLLTEKELAVEELIIAIKSVKKEKAWKVINFLQAEKKIIVQKNGLLQLANKK